MSLDPRHPAALAFIKAKLEVTLAYAFRQNALDAREAHQAKYVPIMEGGGGWHSRGIELERELAKAEAAAILADDKARDAAVVLADECLADIAEGG